MKQTSRAPTFFVSLILTCLLAACGNTPSPSVKEQKERLIKVLAPALQAGAATQNSAQKVSISRKLPPQKALPAPWLMPDLRLPPFRSLYTSTEATLSSCEPKLKRSETKTIQAPFDDLGDTTEVFKFSVKDKDCPISANLEITRESKLLSQRILSKLSYATKDDFLQEHTDLKGLHFIVETLSPGKTSSTSFAGWGYIDSQSEGRVNIGIYGSFDETLELKATFEFRDFLAVVETKQVQRADQQPEQKILFKGEEINEAELFDLFSSLEE